MARALEPLVGPEPSRVPLTDDVVVTARRLTRWMRVLAALQLVVILVVGFAAFGLMFGALLQLQLGIAFVLAVLALVVWVARAAALGRAAADLDDMRRGLVHAHTRVVRGLWGVTLAVLLDGLALALVVALVVTLGWK